MAKTPKALHPITCYDEDTDSFAMPDDVAAVPVVVCTLVTAARLVDKGLPRGHFAYILVDEAAQAKEAEAVVPLALLDPAAGGRLVLGGDPCQLGPVVASNVAKEHGLEVSLMERLMRDFPRYRPGAGGAASGTTFDPAAIVRLVANYRSHGALLTVPSVLFYGGELLALQENLTENPRFSASESQVAWDTEPNPLPWSDLPGIPCNGDLARADRPGISGPLSPIGLDGIPSLSAHPASRANNPRLL